VELIGERIERERTGKGRERGVNKFLPTLFFIACRLAR